MSEALAPEYTIAWVICQIPRWALVWTDGVSKGSCSGCWRNRQTFCLRKRQSDYQLNKSSHSFRMTVRGGRWFLFEYNHESKPCNVGPKSYLRNVAQRGANVSQYKGNGAGTLPHQRLRPHLGLASTKSNDVSTSHMLVSEMGPVPDRPHSRPEMGSVPSRPRSSMLSHWSNDSN